MLMEPRGVDTARLSMAMLLVMPEMDVHVLQDWPWGIMDFVVLIILKL